MDKQTVKKITTFSFLCAAVVAYITVNILFKSFAGAFGVIQKFYSMDVISHGLPLAVAVVLFFVLQFNSKLLAWAEEVVSEISKIVWPSQKDTMAMTMVVCVFVFMASVVLIGIDFVSRELVGLIIK